MSDPRWSDPKPNDLPDNRPLSVRSEEKAEGYVWGWIAGVALLALIFAFVIGGGGNNQTADLGKPQPDAMRSTQTPAPPAASTAQRPSPAPSTTTGSGSSSQ